MKATNTELSQDVIKERLKMAEEMSKIWDSSPETVRMYLKGCIATATALAGQHGEPRAG